MLSLVAVRVFLAAIVNNSNQQWMQALTEK